jgi:hypothetical protein
MKSQLPRRFLIVGGVAAMGLLLGSVLAPARAGSITYVTPANSTISTKVSGVVTKLPVSAMAVFVTGANTLTITLSDVLANPTNIAQTLSDLSFTTSGNNALSGATLSAQVSTSITNITNNAGGYSMGEPGKALPSWSLSPAKTTGTLSSPTGAQFIIGPPNTSNAYSITGKGLPGGKPVFLDQTLAVIISGTNITPSTMITSATFSFGGTTTLTVNGQAVPEPSTLVLGAVGFGLVGAIGFYRSRRRGQAVAR